MRFMILPILALTCTNVDKCGDSSHREIEYVVTVEDGRVFDVCALDIQSTHQKCITLNGADGGTVFSVCDVVKIEIPPQPTAEATPKPKEKWEWQTPR